MRETYNSLGQNKKFHLLPLPVFATDGDFPTVIQRITGHRFQKYMIRKFGEKTKEEGSLFLNNAYLIFRLYENVELNFDRFLNLELHHSIAPENAKCITSMSVIRDFYTMERLIRLLTYSDSHWVEETARIIIDVDEDRNNIKELLPKKAKSFREIHDALSFGLLNKRNHYQNKSLNQDIIFLHGKEIFEYTIEIPTDSDTLIDTSRELKHCLHGYTKSIIMKECQVLNLIANNERQYTIELKPVHQGYEVVQFKGLQNESSMEGQLGRKYREKLNKLLSLQRM